jgi:hypothetical protein
MTNAPGDRDGWLRAYARGLSSIKAFYWEMIGHGQNQNVRHAEQKAVVAVDRTQGPMFYIAQQICKRMAKMGYPSKIAVFFRGPEQQDLEYAEGDSKARAWQSPHQFFEAVDIVHKTLGWQAPPAYWDALAVCVRVMAAELNVKLVHGHHWRFVDSAHIELADWRVVRDRMSAQLHGMQPPRPAQLAERWKEILPSISAT